MSLSLACRLLVHAKSLGMMKEEYAWIITDKAMNSVHSMNFDVIESLQGTLGFKPKIAASSKLQNITSRWTKEYNSKNPYAVFRELPVVGVWAYDMMQALAEAFERVSIETSTVNNQVAGLKSLKISTNLVHSHGGMLLLDELSRVRFEGLSGAFQLVDGKLYPEEFKMVNIVRGNEEEMVGIWRPKDGIFEELYSKAVVWPRGCKITTRGRLLQTMSPKKLRIGVPVKYSFKQLANVRYDPQTNGTTISGYCIDVFKSAVQALDYEVPYELIPISNGTYNDYVHQVYLQEFSFAGEKLTSNLSRIIVLVWVFVVLILTSGYTATLSSLLTVQQIQLGSAGEFLGIQLGSFVGGVIANNLNFKDQRLKQYTSPEEYAEALSRGHKDGGVDAIIDEIPYIKIVLAKYSHDYGIIASSSTTGGFGFVFPKGSPLVPDISKEIIKLREGGQLLRIERAWFKSQSSFLPDGAVTNTNILNFNQFRGLFLVSGICLATALVIYLTQLLLESWFQVKPVNYTNSFDVFPKGSPLVPDISKEIIKLREGGQLLRIERAWFKSQSSFLPDGAVTNTNILNFNQFRGLFLVSGICLATALVIYLTQLLLESWFQVKRFCRRLANSAKALTDESNAGHRIFSMVVSTHVYTVQQKDETIDAARERAITPSRLYERLGDCLIYQL
ncbi:glutamate receptor 2.6 [Forsythia ovata]|uniref:Glutamate receptor 2.6 n=1 Tax=Forsythia ovata TaxID=205694 RepID=A0ABD1RJY7_9LAMI